MDVFYYVANMCLCFFIPLLVVAIAGLFSEKSGVLNMCLEGIMIMGAFAGALFMHYMQDILDGQWLLICTMLVSMVVGMIFTQLHAFAAIKLKADQSISAMALNTFASSFVIFVARSITGSQYITFKNTFRIEKVPFLGDIPVLGKILFQNAYITTYIGLVIIAITIFVFAKTRFGMRLSACGENPQAADSLGINVYNTRYIALAISGALGGLGGLIYIIPTVTSFGGDVYGYGFLAMSVLMLGQWKPVRLLFAALLFSLIKTVASGYMSIPMLSSLGLSDNFYKSLPYIITLVILALSSNKAIGPKACGQPYDKGRR
jgi:simple sugar transport system permease protein